MLAPAPALGSAASINGDTLYIKAAPGEANILFINYGPVVPGAAPEYIINDFNVTVGNGCRRPANSLAICTATGIRNVWVEAGDRDDLVTYDDSMPPVRTFTWGGSGNDRLTGSRAQDWFDGGTGADTISGRGGIDTVSYRTRTTSVTIRLGVARASGNGDDGPTGARDTISADVENARGGFGPDRIFGSQADNLLNGGPGNDFIRGGAGNDVLRGGLHADTLFGDIGRDTLYGGNGADFLRGGSGNDVAYGGLGPDRIRGGPGADRLFGGPGDDHINGLQGDDRIWGGLGRDGLLGQQGIDWIFAGDGHRDLKINCGPGNPRKERAVVDRLDPRAVGCGPPVRVKPRGRRAARRR